MSLSEAAMLLERLCCDTTSHAFAALSGWSYPMSQEALATASLYDVYMEATRKKFTPYSRPWSNKGKTTERRGVETSLTQDEVIAALRAAGHDMPVPTRST